jgi:hypothetical protein
VVENLFAISDIAPMFRIVIEHHWPKHGIHHFEMFVAGIGYADRDWFL